MKRNSRSTLSGFLALSLSLAIFEANPIQMLANELDDVHKDEVMEEVVNDTTNAASEVSLIDEKEVKEATREAAVQELEDQTDQQDMETVNSMADAETEASENSKTHIKISYDAEVMETPKANEIQSVQTDLRSEPLTSQAAAMDTYDRLQAQGIEVYQAKSGTVILGLDKNNVKNGVLTLSAGGKMELKASELKSLGVKKIVVEGEKDPTVPTILKITGIKDDSFDLPEIQDPNRQDKFASSIILLLEDFEGTINNSYKVQDCFLIAPKATVKTGNSEWRGAIGAKTIEVKGSVSWTGVSLETGTHEFANLFLASAQAEVRIDGQHPGYGETLNFELYKADETGKITDTNPVGRFKNYFGKFNFLIPELFEKEEGFSGANYVLKQVKDEKGMYDLSADEYVISVIPKSEEVDGQATFGGDIRFYKLVNGTTTPVDQMVFNTKTNTDHFQSEDLHLKGNVTVKGGSFADKEFQFILSEYHQDTKKEEVLQKVANDANGNFKFDAIDFSNDPGLNNSNGSFHIYWIYQDTTVNSSARIDLSFKMVYVKVMRINGKICYEVLEGSDNPEALNFYNATGLNKPGQSTVPGNDYNDYDAVGGITIPANSSNNGSNSGSSNNLSSGIATPSSYRQNTSSADDDEDSTDGRSIAYPSRSNTPKTAADTGMSAWIISFVGALLVGMMSFIGRLRKSAK